MNRNYDIELQVKKDLSLFFSFGERTVTDNGIKSYVLCWKTKNLISLSNANTCSLVDALHRIDRRRWNGYCSILRLCWYWFIGMNASYVLLLCFNVIWKSGALNLHSILHLAVTNEKKWKLNVFIAPQIVFFYIFDKWCWFD